jgi:hypothetical protein
MLIQFLEDCGDWKQTDAELKAYEPSVTWTLPELAALCRACGVTSVPAPFSRRILACGIGFMRSAQASRHHVEGRSRP